MIASYINLQLDAARRARVEEQIASAGLSFPITRFDAIRGSERREVRTSLTAAQLGCYLSHLELIRGSMSHDEDVLVLEDDERFGNDLNGCIELVQELQSVDWDILYLDATIVEIEDTLLLSRRLWRWAGSNLPPQVMAVPRAAHFYGTHGYVVNRKSRARVVGLLGRNLESGLPIDNILCAASKQGVLACWCAVPFLCGPSQESSSSTINQGVAPLVPHWLRFRELAYVGSTRRPAPEYRRLLYHGVAEGLRARIDSDPIATFEPDYNQSFLT